MISKTILPNWIGILSLPLIAAILIVLLLVAPQPALAADSDEEIAVSVATLLRSARAVISQKQKHINDPDVGDKGVSADFVVATAKDNYKEATGKNVDDIDPNSLHGQLIAAELKAIRDVMDAAQGPINKKGVGFKGFLPAVFARQVSQAFGQNSGGKASLKLTAPKEWVRNRSNKPDRWEHDIIQNTFKKDDHPKGQHVAAEEKVKGKDAYRLILPEYYKESCLACHGEPAGETDITGGKKEGGKLGQLGGAISVVLFR